ncbi:MAG: hypothetical protein AB7O67_06235 [Vicinamibacterales bacterium]
MRKGRQTRRMLELGGMLAIGDSILALVRPRQHTRLWRPRRRSRWQRSIAWFEAHPRWTRGLAVLGVAAGIGLALSQYDRAS